jgi:hypothetical protein
MNAIFDAHPLTLIIVTAAVMVTPFYMLCLYVFSGASPRKGAIIGSVFLAWGAAMTWVCASGLVGGLGPPGQAIIPIAWIAPSAVLVAYRSWFLAEPLSQRWIIGLQIWRVIGGVFLIEMVRGNAPAVFAYPAGIGDLIAGLLALAVLLVFRRAPAIPALAVAAVAAVGTADFLSAIFFGMTSSPGPQQLFVPPTPSRLLEFPTGMIPLFLVPYAIFFHTLSVLVLRGEARGAAASTAAAA